MEYLDSEVKEPIEKKTDADRKRRQSLPHDRRSSRVITLTDGENKLCHNIPREIPSEERLQLLLNQSIQVAINEAFDKVSDLNLAHQLKSSLKLSLGIPLDDCISRGLLRSAVSPSKKKRSFPDTDTSKVKESIVSAEKCIKRLKTESDMWDILLEQHKNKAELINRHPSTLKNVLGKLDGNSVCRDLEYFENLTTQHQRILLHMKVLNQSAATLKKFYRQSEYRLGDSVRHFYTARTNDLSDEPIKLLCAAPTSGQQ